MHTVFCWSMRLGGMCRPTRFATSCIMCVAFMPHLIAELWYHRYDG